MPPFIAAFISKFGFYLILITALIGMTTGLYLKITHDAKVEQRYKDEIATLNQAVKEQQKTITDLNAIIEINNQSIDDLNKNLDNVQTEFNAIKESINTPEMLAKDRPASDIFKTVLEQLKSNKKETK